jgi:hypothetical protein
MDEVPPLRFVVMLFPVVGVVVAVGPRRLASEVMLRERVVSAASRALTCFLAVALRYCCAISATTLWPSSPQRAACGWTMFAVSERKHKRPGNDHFHPEIPLLTARKYQLANVRQPHKGDSAAVGNPGGTGNRAGRKLLKEKLQGRSAADTPPLLHLLILA